jgi:hypothetical protein
VKTSIKITVKTIKMICLVLMTKPYPKLRAMKCLHQSTEEKQSDRTSLNDMKPISPEDSTVGIPMQFGPLYKLYKRVKNRSAGSKHTRRQ